MGDALTGEPDPFFGQQFHPYLWEKGVMRDKFAIRTQGTRRGEGPIG